VAYALSRFVAFLLAPCDSIWQLLVLGTCVDTVLMLLRLERNTVTGQLLRAYVLGADIWM
jgi:hypothetical protein